MLKKIGLAVSAIIALAAVYLFVPPPHQASAQFVDQLTFGGTSTGSVTGSTTAYAITIPNLSANPLGVVLRFIPNITSVGPTQINVSGLGLVNVLRHSSIGNVAFSGGEFQAGELTCIEFDGTNYQLACNVDMRSIGSTIEVRGSVAPRGSMIEDGSCVSQTTYAALFTVIGTTYGTCSAGLFKLPFSNGTAFFAFDNQGTNGAANRITTASCATPNSPAFCGSQLATLTAGLIPTINVTVTSTTSDFLRVPTGTASPGGTGIVATTSDAVTSTGSSTNTGGSSVSHPVLPPNLPGIRAIKY